MNIPLITVILIAISLSMDAFAVALSCGCSMNKHDLRKSLEISFYFGFFQGFMPLLGFAAGSLLMGVFHQTARLIAASLLAYIGSKMIYDGFHYQRCFDHKHLSLWKILTLALATSIDALAVGISFSLLGYKVFITALIIGVTTFFISFSGVYSGFLFKETLGKYAELAGGLILILIAFNSYF